MNALRGPKRKRAKASPILIVLLLCALNVFSFVMLRGAAYRSESSLLKASSERIAAQVAAQLQTMLALGRQLQTMLLSDEGKDYARIKAIAEESIAANPFIDSITIAPGAIVRYAFPEEKNSSSIGHDLLNNPERMQALVEAVRTKQAVLQGPSVTAEGKNLAFLRIPVLNKTDLWGFVSIGFDTDRLLSAFEFSSAFPGLSIALVYSSPDDGGTRVFWGDQRALRGYAAEVMEGKGEAEVFPWAVYTASAYPAVRVVWWGVGMLVLNMVGLGLFVLGTVQRPSIVQQPSTMQRRRRSSQEAQESRTAVEEDRALSSEKAGPPKVSFVVKPFVPEPREKEPQPSIAEKEPSPKRPEPVVEETIDERSSTAAPAAIQKTAPEVPMAPLSVLVVDDSEVNRELLLRMLVLKGYEAEAVSSGALALEALKERRFDLLVIDCIMPGMDGYALASIIRAAGREQSSVPTDLVEQKQNSMLERPALLAMSPRHDPDEVKKCIDAGFDALLIKPFTMTSLDQKIRETLNHRA
ncbi:MAG TPA: hypothetical protein DDZ37_05550 [Spirochaetaceae bacterium]|nr:hypothetical protein [Spirochaetaceae bacterium]